MSNSELVNYTKLSPNNSGKRTMLIDRITPHCTAGQITIKALGDMFYKKATKASSNYGIGRDGQIGLFVDEANRSWCTSSGANDHRAITIECASDARAPYAMSDTVYNRLIDLTVDICRRNGKNKLIWIPDKDTALLYVPKKNELLVTVHRWFANKSCPGDWFYSRIPEYVNTVNKLINNVEYFKPYLVRVKTSGVAIKKTASKTSRCVKECPVGTYTIVEEKNGYGLLKSRAGWVKLSSVEVVK